MTKRECAFQARGRGLRTASKEPAETRDQITVTALASRLAEVIKRHDAQDKAEGAARNPYEKNRWSVLAAQSAEEKSSLEKLICSIAARNPDEELMQMILTFATLDIMESAEELRSTEDDRRRAHYAVGRIIAGRQKSSALPKAIFDYYLSTTSDPGEGDQHAEWWSEIQRLDAEQDKLREQNNEKDAQALHDRRWELLNLLSSTPASTLEGLHAQASCLAEFMLDEHSNWTGHPDLTMARNVAASLSMLIAKSDEQKA